MPDTAQNAQRIDPGWAWDRYRPTREDRWDLRKVGHLYRRAGFGANDMELQAGLSSGPERAVSVLLEGTARQDEFDRQMTARIPSLQAANNGQQATAWWLYRMLYTPHPLREKMTLFWHDHFATSNLKVNNVGYMLRQNELLRRLALGNFATMLQEISLDPAMLVWLDTIESRRGQPNENYARELMELFSLGLYNPLHPGRANYTEQDIREAARAFTGYRIENGRGVFRDNLHDPSEKNVLGRRGNWKGEDIVRICLEQEACPYFVMGKLFRFLVGETIEPSRELIAPLATAWRQNNFNTGLVVERILRSNLFYSPRVYRTKIKSPVEIAIGIVRGLEGRIGTVALGTALEGLGQRLFYPPSVAGWDEGQAWLNGQTLLFRHNLALALTSTQDDRFGRRNDPAGLLRRLQIRGDENQVAYFLHVFLQGDVTPETRTRLLQYYQNSRTEQVPVFWTEADAQDQRIRSICHLVLTLPEYQLG